MAANKFATLIHRKTNRITLVLVYAFLEWSLIFFIFLNSLFSYFILRFADYFGLKRPCLFCSRLDRFFDASGKSPSHKDLLCHDHALEISTPHSKSPLESNGFRGETFFSSDEFREDLVEKKRGYAPIVDDLGRFPIGLEAQVHNGFLFSTELSRSILGSVNLNDSEEEETEEKLPSENHEQEDKNKIVHHSPEKLEEEDDEVTDSDDSDDEDKEEEEVEFSCYVSSFDFNNKQALTQENKMDLAAVEVEETSQEMDDNKPVDSTTAKNLEFYIDDQDLIPVEFYKPSEEVREISDVNGDFILDFGAEPDFPVKHGEISGEISKPDDAGKNLDDSVQMENDDEEEETDAEVSIGTEIPDHEQIGDFPSPELIPNDEEDDNHGEDTLEFRTVTMEAKRPVLNINEERLLETQGSAGSLHGLHNAMFQLGQRGFGTESLDSMECPEGVLTVDKLKSELQEERKAINALYQELEEERSASATAASETMAMINRLHEEKAAMQMEALQYQRMMEEQSEFDQEALQLLNELMVKKERENTELEKELEKYRKRLEEYEAKEKMAVLRMRMRDSSVDSYRNNGDSDDNNSELHHKNVEGVSDFRENEMENTPVDIVLRLDECLDDYEGERLSILGRLKFLEEKLTALNDEEDEEEEEVKTFESNGHINGNGHYHDKETNGKHRVIKSKRLLPLFDAVDGEMENGNHYENGYNESETGEVGTVEEEMEELYERLEALEADREFLRHCVGSLKKGDKGVHLLHEILQQLRDLKNIDLIRIRENGDMTF